MRGMTILYRKQNANTKGMVKDMSKCVKTKGNSCGLCCTKVQNFGVTKGKTIILKDVNLHIHCGDLTALIGPNGAGKTTLLKAILGEISHSGELIFIHENQKKNSNPIIGYVPQQLNFDKGSPTSVLDLFRAANSNIPIWISSSNKVKAHAIDVLSKVQAEHLIDRKLGNLSGGELQRVFLALAIDPVPDLLLLDEPVSGIDQRGMELFYNIISDLRKKYDMSIILVSHDLPLVCDYADRVVFLNKTVIASGMPKEVFTNKDVIDVFGTSWAKGRFDICKEEEQ